MAIAKKCDRCGAFHDLYNVENDSKNINALMTLNTDFRNHYFSQKIINLCPDCLVSFQEWIKMKKLFK